MTARSSAEQVEEALGRIQALDGRLGAFVTVLAERARAEAAARDAERAAGRVRGPLHGVPVAVKDLIDVAGVVTAAGSPKLADHRAERDAPLVARLREAGAVVIGKTRTHEFAYGVLTPGTVNPWDEARIAGGSSGGSAAAVAAGLVRHAVGSDTAGSIRIPAACCGVVGLKPTYGAVPARGVFPLSWSCDTLGPIAGDVAAATRLFEVLSGRPAPERAVPAADRPLRLGRLVGDDLALVDPAVRGELDRLCGLLEARGARIDEVKLPLAAARAAVAAIVLPELAAAHERLLAGTGEQGYGPRVLAAIRLGQSALATEYLAGLRYRGPFVARVEALLEERDALLLETVPVVAPQIGAGAVRLGDGRDAGIQESLTALPGAFNCSGSPVVSLPIGLVGGLPVGASLVGRIGADHELLRVAAAVEDAAGFSGRPALHATPPDPTDVAAYDEQLRRSWVGETPVLRAPIEIREYDPEWPRSYGREAARVRSVLGNRVVRLEHAGSTSVPGLPAKPIIDMVLEVPDSGDEAAYVPDMEAAGYVLRIREPEWFQHRVFKGPDTDVNLHVFSSGCAETDRMLRFRDWLRRNAADRELYTRVKRELAARDWKYMQQYADAKTAVVLEIMARAEGAEAAGPS